MERLDIVENAKISWLAKIKELLLKKSTKKYKTFFEKKSRTKIYVLKCDTLNGNNLMKFSIII